MRWTETNWQTARNKVVRLNTLTTLHTHFPATSRVGIVHSATPTLYGTKLLVTYRHGKEWANDYFTTCAGVIPVLEESAQERVLRAYRRDNLKQTVENIGRGFKNSLGADPEIFTVTKENQLLPAWEFLPPKGHNVDTFWDGFQAEFTTPTETCLAWFLDHIRAGLVRVHKAAKAKGGQLALTDVIEVPADILANAAEEHVRFGCDPSKNAYHDAAQLDAKPRELEIRFAGGHMHFGDTAIKTEEHAIPVVKALDAIWGVISVSLFEGLECPLRRVYYGRAGEYRLPPHGLEYRVPSNAWLCHPAIAQLSWTLARQAFYIGINNMLSGVWNADETEVRRVINDLDVEGARKILKANRVTLNALLRGYFNENHGRMDTTLYHATKQFAINHALAVILKGAATVLAEPKNLVRNWMLEAPTDPDRWYKPTSEEERKADTTWHLHSETGMAQWCVAAAAIERGERI